MPALAALCSRLQWFMAATVSSPFRNYLRKGFAPHSRPSRFFPRLRGEGICGAPVVPSPCLRGERLRVDFSSREVMNSLSQCFHHVAVLVHHRVPARDLAHALFERAAIADGTGLLHDLAFRREDITLRRLAFDPVAPLALRPT